jgi:hypothetical protein
VAGERLAQRRPGGAQLGGGGVDAAELLGELEGPFGFAPVDQEAAGLPAHPWLEQSLTRRREGLGLGGVQDGGRRGYRDVR